MTIILINTKVFNNEISFKVIPKMPRFIYCGLRYLTATKPGELESTRFILHTVATKPGELMSQ
jgi:hypothetical protein